MASVVDMRSGFMRLALSSKVAGILVDNQGINGVTELVDIRYKDIKGIIKALRRPGWVVVNNAAAISDGCFPVFVDLRVVVTISATIHLKVAYNFICHRACMSREVTLD